MRRDDSGTSAPSLRDPSAQASLLLMTPVKWRLVRMFDAMVRFLKFLMPPLPPVKNLTEAPVGILVVEYWNLGDLAILVPFIRNLRRSFPSARIALLVNPALASFLGGQRLVDEFIPVRVPWARHFNRLKKYNPFSLDWISLARTMLALRKRRFDWAFSGRMDLRDNLMLWLSGAHRRIAYGIGGCGFFFNPESMTGPCRLVT